MEHLKGGEIKTLESNFNLQEGFGRIAPKGEISSKEADELLDNLCSFLSDEPISEGQLDIDDDILDELTNDLDAVDDNGQFYKLAGFLVPDNQYEINGYKYETDSQGRIVRASGELHLSDMGRKTINENRVGGDDKCDTDDRGHLIADRFGATNKIDNLVAMDSNLNRGAYKALENKLADALSDNHKVNMEVNVYYKGDSERPSSFLVKYSVDGEKFQAHFTNERSE